MSETAQTQDPVKEAEEKAKIAKARQEEIEAELKAAKAKKELEGLNDPPSEKSVAETNKAIAEANKAEFEAKKAQLQGPEVTPPTGKFTGSGIFIESQILARRVLTQCFSMLTTEMVKQTPFKKTISLVLYNQPDFAAMELYTTLLQQVNSMSKQMKATSNEVSAKIKAGPDVASLNLVLAGYAVSGVLKSAASIVGLFKTTTDITHTDFAVDETILAATLKSVILASTDNTIMTWKVFTPATYPVHTIKLTEANSPFIEALNKLNTEDLEAKKQMKAITEETKKQNEILDKEATALKQEESKIPAGDPVKKAAFAEKLSAFNAKKNRVKEYLDELTDLNEHLKILTDAFSKLQNLLSTADAATKVTAQTLVMRAERLVMFLNTDSVFVIKLSATTRGSNKITDNLWRNGRIEHSGGATLDCIVFDPSGEVIFSNTQQHYTPYILPKDIDK